MALKKLIILRGEGL